MKVTTLTNVLTKTTIESDCAKIGFRYKYALGAAFTQALALTKWQALANTIDIALVTGNGTINIAFKANLRRLAEVSALDLSNVVIKQSLTANFAEAFFSIDLTAGGSLPLGADYLSIDCAGIVSTEELDVYAINVPFYYSDVLTYSFLRATANNAKNVDLTDALMVSFSNKIAKVELVFASGVQMSYELNEIALIMYEDNQQIINIEGLAHIQTSEFAVPVVSVSNGTFYATSDEDILIVRAQ